MLVVSTHAPPRLQAMVSLVRESMPHLMSGCAGTTRETHGIPRHVLTGSLRRGWLAGVADRVAMAAEEDLIARRGAAWEEARALRPQGVSVEDWDAEIVRSMQRHAEPAKYLEELRAQGA